MSNGIYGYYDKEKKYVVYIGQDSNIDKNERHKAHYRPSAYNSQQINRVLQNNPNRYDYFVLAEGDFSQKEIDDMEKQAINIFKTYHYDYPERSVFNFTKGGDFNPMKVPEITVKRSGKNHPMYGKKHSKEARRKMSENHADVSGKNNPNYGKKLSEEHKKKLSEAKKGKYTGENHPRYKNYVRITKAGFCKNKQQYLIKKDGKIIKRSINKEKLKKWFKEQYPDEKLVDES